MAMLKAATNVITETNFMSYGFCYEKSYGSCSGKWDTEHEKVRVTYTGIKMLHSRTDCAFESRLQY